ncbi:MAG: hypothetical protein HYY06_21030 [Deltaproteobacteria bacterium]|nr:hypothetical protein [Deltaproteobacteria bacterium]
MAARLFHLICIAMVAGCAADFESPSEVLDLRILALQATPPELLLDDDLPPVELVALVADPRDPDREVTYRWRACGLTAELRCSDADWSVDLGEGSAPVSSLTGVLEIGDDLRAAAAETDTFMGFGGLFFVAQLTLEESEAERRDAIKQIPGSAAFPGGTSENRNPSPPGLLHDEAEWPEPEVLEVAPGAEVSVEPTAPGGDAESYSVYRFDLGVQDLEEYLGYSFFASAGTWTRDGSGGSPDPISIETSLASVWTAPDEEADVTIWVVVRDGRGGTAWTRREVRVR